MVMFIFAIAASSPFSSYGGVGVVSCPLRQGSHLVSTIHAGSTCVIEYGCYCVR